MSVNFTMHDLNMHESRLKASKSRKDSICGVLIAKPSNLCLTFNGQIMGGKNNIIITRTGLRFPKPAWAKWRDAQVASIKSQLPYGFKAIDVPTNIRIEYVAGDKRRRDMPAIVDAIFHVLEKAGVVTDDTHLWASESTRAYSKEVPQSIVTFL